MRKTYIKAVSAAWMACLALGAGARFSTVSAATFKIVANVTGTAKGEGGVDGVLAADTEGNLYVEATFDPPGDLFELTAKSGYSQVQKLYRFGSGNQADGVDPLGGVTLTASDVIVGTCYVEGNYGEGTAFNLGTPRNISMTTLHAFSGGQTKPHDGSTPEGGLAPGLFNRYYGTTPWGGIRASSRLQTGDGTLYEISASTTVGSYKVLHHFGGPSGDGITPTAAKLASDPQGRLYGETYGGGANAAGTVFMMQYGAAGWQEQIIYSFPASGNLLHPPGNVVLDTQGNLYACAQGGTHNQGGIFRLAPPTQTGGAWQETTLYNFGDQADDPNTGSGTGQFFFQDCGITMDATTGMIVGVSSGGGKKNVGTIYTVAPPADGESAWTETVGYSFEQHYDTGFYPTYAPLELKGVYYGGTFESGAIYAFTP